MSFKDYSLTPADNTGLGDGTYIGPGMFRNKVRPAFQQLAADGKELADQVAALPASKHDRYIDPQDAPFNAKADGTDDAAALQAALNTGKRVYLDPAVTYAFGSQLIPPSGGGFVGHGKLLMLTGTGQFDMDDYTGDPLTYSGILLEGKSDVRIEAKIEMQANAGIRCCNAIWIRNCTDVHLDVECWGFKETRYGLVEWNSNMGGSVKAYVHDCNPNSTTLPTMQVTALSVDSNRYDPGTGPVNSRRLRFDVNAVNLALGAAALATYGPQTDGVNLQGNDAFAGHVGTVTAENVDEPLDCWSDHNVITVNARDCFWGVKLIYGASHNLIHATVHSYQKAAIVYAGNTGTQPTAYNRCYVSASGGGQIGSEGDVAGVRFEDPTGIQEADSNYTEITCHGDGVNLDYLAQLKSGSNNAVKIKGDGYAVSASLNASSGTGNVITVE